MEKSRTTVTLVGLVFTLALVGTAVAGPDALNRAITKSKVKQIAKKQANKAISARAPNLDVKSAKDADSLGGQPPSAFAPSAVEPYHEVGEPGEPGFGTGWANTMPADLTTAAFYKDPFGLVHLKGTVTGGNGVIFVLPPGYRPTKVNTIPTLGGDPPSAPGYIFIYPEGEVSAVPSGTQILLDGITFRAGTG